MATKKISDFEDLLNIFNSAGIKYVVVGGHAFMFYAEPRYTKDLDLWIDTSAENAHLAYRALAQLGAPLRNVVEADFTNPEVIYQLGAPPVRIDVLGRIEAVF